MNIITWNCQMAFRKKANKILAYDPDILVIPESESKEKIDFGSHVKAPSQSIWIGNNINKGLLVCSYNEDISININEQYNEDYKYILPIDVKVGEKFFLMLAVWTQDTKNTYSSYIVQLYRAIDYYKELFDNKTLILGDLNSNVMWDYYKKEANHTDVVNILDDFGIKSIYHRFNNVVQGKEVHNTLYMFRKEHKPYHIDYIFAGKYWQRKLQNLDIGQYQDWIEYSDHMPLIANFTA